MYGQESDRCHVAHVAMQGQMTHDMSAGGAEAGASAASGHNKPSGLPLRKSQSALELSSWRSFGGLDELWDAENGALDPALVSDGRQTNTCVVLCTVNACLAWCFV